MKPVSVNVLGPGDKRTEGKFAKLVGAFAAAVIYAFSSSDGLGGEANLHLLPPVAPMPMPSNAKVIFGPGKDLESAVVKALKQARTEILVNQWAITSQPIGRALVDAFQNPRSGKPFVGVILDENPAIVNYQGPEFFRLNKVPYVYAAAKGRNDANYCVIDRRIVLVGFPWLAAAKKGNAVLMVLDDPGIAAQFAAHWIEESATAKIPVTAAKNLP